MDEVSTFSLRWILKPLLCFIRYLCYYCFDGDSIWWSFMVLLLYLRYEREIHFGMVALTAWRSGVCIGR